tara:strand:- start:1427 stop:3004 length:1578 start_codon:yes stop_codon:yes gene_type:complete
LNKKNFLFLLILGSLSSIVYLNLSTPSLGKHIETIKISFNPNDKFWGENLFKRKYGDIICEGKTLTSVQTRIITNFLDLEIFCRNPNLEFSPKFVSFPKPSTSLIGSFIQNYNGKLYSVTSGEIFNFEKNIWEPATNDLGGLYYLQPYKDGWVKIFSNKNICEGLIFKMPSGITFCIESKNTSAILVWNDKVYVNDDGNLVIYEIPKTNTLYSPLAPINNIEGNDWSYFIVPNLNRELMWGGSYGTKDIDGLATKSLRCANLNILNKKFQNLKPESCLPGQIKEWYSVVKKNNALLIGNFPDGGIYQLNKDGSIVKTKLGIGRSDDFLDPKFKTRYRESQSLLSSAGFLWIGMYPFGEIIIEDLINSDNESLIIRLFKNPQRDNSPSPYFKEYIEEFNEFYGRNENVELVYSFISKNTEKTLRQLGIEPLILAQRIPSLVALDGMVCGSTANLSWVSPPVQVLDKLNIETLDEYGKVHCALINNQTLISNNAYKNFQIKIYKNGFQVYSKSKLIKTVKFKNLSIN